MAELTETFGQVNLKYYCWNLVPYMYKLKEKLLLYKRLCYVSVEAASLLILVNRRSDHLQVAPSTNWKDQVGPWAVMHIVGNKILSALTGSSDLAIVYAANQFINSNIYEYLQWNPCLKLFWQAMDLNIKLSKFLNGGTLTLRLLTWDQWSWTLNDGKS
jgi:hypothetical protein